MNGSHKTTRKQQNARVFSKCSLSVQFVFTRTGSGPLVVAEVAQVVVAVVALFSGFSRLSVVGHHWHSSQESVL